MSSFGLPIGANGVPSIGGTGGGFGQPSGVSIGPASGGFGSVASTHPGSTFQQTVGPRSNVRFQVQPQVTVACEFKTFSHFFFIFQLLICKLFLNYLQK